MATVIPQEDQQLSGEYRVLLNEINHLQRQVAALRKDSAADFVMGLGSPEPGTVFAHGYLGPRIKRTLVDGVEVPEVVIADTARGFVIFTVQPAQVKPGTDEIWMDIKCGKVTFEYEGSPGDLRDSLRAAAARRPQSES